MGKAEEPMVNDLAPRQRAKQINAWSETVSARQYS